MAVNIQLSSPRGVRLSFNLPGTLEASLIIYRVVVGSSSILLVYHVRGDPRDQAKMANLMVTIPQECSLDGCG